jgi:hypothetical protein
MAERFQDLPQSREFWDAVIGVTLSGARRLREKLGISETEFRRVSPLANNTGRACYFYRVLDEVQKAGCSILHWKEFLAGTMQ